MYSPFRHIGSVLWKRRPIHLTMFLTRRCNASCPFCFYLSESGLDGRDRPELSLEEISRISDSMGKLLWLAFSGGEIFLRQDIVEIAGTFYRRNEPAIMLFPTNGLLTDAIYEKTERILKECPNSTIVVKLSLDGTEKVHDSIRGMKGGFRKTMAAYEKLSTLLQRYPNFELGINTVFCSANQDHMEEIITFVRKLEHIKTHTVSLIRGAVADERLKSVNMDRYFEAINMLASDLRVGSSAVYRFRGGKLKAAQDVLQRRLIYETYVHNRQMLPCYAGRLNLVITETGDLYPCEEFSMKLGNVRENGYDVDRMLASPGARKTVDMISERGCFCTHECYFMTNILFNPRMYPALFMEYLRLR